MLLIDDGASRSKAFQRLSSGVGVGRHLVDRVTTAEDAFDAIVDGEHDVYVLDHLVGTRTGFDVLSWVKAREMQIPIVFVSGRDDHGTGVSAVTAGASCYVVEDSIESGLLEHSVRYAVEQLTVLFRLRSAGIAVDSDTSTKTRLLFHVAERLREPAAAVLDEARRSLEFDLPAPALKSFGLIEDKANTLLTLANDLNDLSLLEAGHLRFNAETFGLRGLVSHMSKTVGSAVREHDAEISVEIDSDVPDAVIGDPGRLRLVIVSFVESVMARGASNRIIVKVRVEQRATESITLRFEIEGDTRGSALDSSPSADHTPIESDGHWATSLEGGALGMPVALETVSRMGGSVTVDESQDRAASVRFTIRLQVSDIGHESRPNLDDHDPMEGPILVIADSVSARRSIMSSLSGVELPYVVAPSVEAWIDRRMAGDDEVALPVLAVIDSTHDSFTMCDRFNDAVSASVPVVVVVASGKRGDAARCRERGVRGYLARPLDSGDLVEVIQSSMALAASGDATTLVTRHWLREGRPSLRVLVVDDSGTNRFLMTRMLEQRGHSAAIACDGSEAVDAIQRDSFDVVLMDVAMPGMDGLDATRLIREMDTTSTTQPLIVGVSAFADQVNIDRAEDAGMDGFLAKPIHPDDLFDVIEQQRSTVLT